MAPGAGLSLRQEQFLAVVLEQNYILENFYLSGGTALSSWYLHHRESYDLDFFSNRPFNGERIATWLKENQEKLDCQAITTDEDWGFYTFFFRYPDDSRLKIDFNHYSYSRLEKGIHWRGLEIDSLYDIAVNKAHTICTHPRERDYVDLYFIMKKTNWDINKLLADADQKFKSTVGLMQMSKNFLKAAEITDYPKMLVPFDPNEMINFYENLAKGLKSKIWK